MVLNLIIYLFSLVSALNTSCSIFTLQTEVNSIITFETTSTFIDNNYCTSEITETITSNTILIQDILVTECETILANTIPDSSLTVLNIPDSSLIPQETVTETTTLTENVFIPQETTTLTENIFIPQETVTITETTTLTENIFIPQETLTITESALNSQETGVLNIENFSSDNFCKDQLIANGTQFTQESCSNTIQGNIPSVNNMVSTIILEPQGGTKLILGQDFTVKLKSINIEFGYFDDPNTLYYSSPQVLNDVGNIKGHSHIVIQKINNINTVPLATSFIFFKGLNEPGIDGELSVDVPGNLFNTLGTYRICTLTSSQSHAPVLMPIARRGFSDDCVRIQMN